MLYVDSAKCNGCGDCLEVCPTGAIGLVDGKAVINESECVGCGVCLRMCSQGAIREVRTTPVSGRGHETSAVGPFGKEVSEMPFGDGTGPRGQGPMTGRGAGYCSGYSAPGYAGPPPGWGGYGYGVGRGTGYGVGYGTGYGMGRGVGRGWGMGYGRGRGMGRGWGMGYGMGRGGGRGWGWRAPSW